MIGDLLAVSALAAMIGLLVWRWRGRRRDDHLLVMEAWLENFSPDAYLPMLRLVERGDAGFLTSRRGTAEAKRYRRLQRRILKDYLRAMSRDFHRLHILATEDDRENPSPALVEEKMDFAFSMWSIDLRLLLNDIAPSAVNLRPLLASADRLTAKAREVVRRRLAFRVA